mmetsp:Transcript_14481/g.49803  ORF Transcript_14481/g.49803 Transcript_14481/m.49803 type:complete len:142 (-) Transcript_14481:399-824(-)
MAVSVRSSSFARLSAARRAPSASRRGLVVPRAGPEQQESSTSEDRTIPKGGIDFKGLKQLVSMGLGTISGDITEINLNDPTRTVVMELEANNFEDKDGNPLQYIDNDGYVEDSKGGAPPFVAIGLGLATVGGVAATLAALS